MRSVQRQLDDGPCEAFTESVKVLTSHAFMYPDVVATCAKSPAEADFADSPVVIVEVLSESTEEADRGRKWFAYQGIDSLRAYLLVAQDKVAVESYSRQAGGWQYAKLQSLDDVVSIATPEIRLVLREIYERVVA